MYAREEKVDRRKHSRVFHRTFSLIKDVGKCNSWLFILPTGSRFTVMVQLADSVYGQLGVACVASVSNRVIARKLERKQKKG